MPPALCERAHPSALVAVAAAEAAAATAKFSRQLASKGISLRVRRVALCFLLSFGSTLQALRGKEACSVHAVKLVLYREPQGLKHSRSSSYSSMGSWRLMSR